VSSVLGWSELNDFAAMIDQSELDYAVRTLPFREALAKLRTLDASGTIPQARYEEVIVYLYSREAERIAKVRGWLEGAALFDEALSSLPASGKLSDLKAIYRGNFASEAHNKFAALFNAKRYAEAMAALDAAIPLVPESELLRKDADSAVKALKQK
jgi:hypothetical protein